MKPPRVLFLVDADVYFRNHRLALARACRQSGADVFVLTHVSGPIGDLEAEGFHVISWKMARGGVNPLFEVRSLAQVVRVYRAVRPDLVHHVALKAIVYGGLAARLLRISAVNAVTGLGYVFTASSIKARILRSVLWFLLRTAMGHSRACAIFENREDLEALVKHGAVAQAQAFLIRGSGVDPQQFAPVPEQAGIPTVIFPTRMLWNKGVGVFVDAVRILRERGVQARFALVGEGDSQNPESISNDQLREWDQSGMVEWWGHRSDMPAVYGMCNLVCFPSYYGEGVPRVLLEAAATGRAIITTDTPGCNDIVRHEHNGLLVPARNSAALADAIARLAADANLRSCMGARGREFVLREFAIEHVVAQTLDVYRSLFRCEWPQMEQSLTNQAKPV